MKHVLLGDICDIQSGGTPSRSCQEYWKDGDIPWVKISDISGKYIKSTEEKISQLGLDNSSAKIFPAGTILYTIFATLGTVGVLEVDAATNQAIAGLQLKDKRVVRDFLYYYLESCKSKVNAIGRGVAQNNINMKILKAFEVPLYNVDKQKEIVKKFNVIENLLCKYEYKYNILEQLVKSRFVEMFGDPVTNSKGLPTRKGEDFFKLSNGKAVHSDKRKESGVPAYGGNGISWYTDDVLCSKDTIVVGRVGFQSGNVHYAEAPIWITDNAMYVSWYDENSYDLKFLCAMMEYINFSKFQDMGDLKKVTQKPFMEFSYICPPLQEQRQYVDFVALADKSKFAIQQSVATLQILKAKLMQDYFG